MSRRWNLADDFRSLSGRGGAGELLNGVVVATTCLDQVLRVLPSLYGSLHSKVCSSLVLWPVGRMYGATIEIAHNADSWLGEPLESGCLDSRSTSAGGRYDTA